MYRTVMLLLAVMFSPVVVAAQQPCTTDSRQVVNELYRHMLERSAGNASTHWVEELQSGRLDVREVVRQIAKSPEHVQRFHYTEAGESIPYERSVSRLYQHLLGRQPDPGGLRAHAEMARRSGAGAVIDSILDSAEYSRLFGDWGVPGSGGIRYCPPNGRASSQNTVVPVPERFRGMDRNNDGRISRDEWRGDRQSFDVQDWNHDGVLVGDEINEPPALGRGRGRGRGRGGEDDAYDRAIRFEDLDANRNGRIESREWTGTVTAFNRLDQNNDNVLSRAEVVDSNLGGTSADGTSGQRIRVEATERWTDTGIDVRAGDTLRFDGQGTVALSGGNNDTASMGGALNGRRAPEAPLTEQSAGALIARIGYGNVFLIGNRRSLQAPASGRLYLGVNDDYLGDNTGAFEVGVTAQGR